MIGWSKWAKNFQECQKLIFLDSKKFEQKPPFLGRGDVGLIRIIKWLISPQVPKLRVKKSTIKYSPKEQVYQVCEGGVMGVKCFGTAIKYILIYPRFFFAVTANISDIEVLIVVRPSVSLLATPNRNWL